MKGARPVQDGTDQGHGGTGSGRVFAAAILGAGVLGAGLLVAAEFTTLFTVHLSARTSAPPLKTVQTGAHHSYAMIPIAVLAAALTVAAVRGAGRPALLAIGALGIAALLIALLGDLPDARATGLVGSGVTNYADARSVPAVGLYLETLGAIVVILASGAGLFLLGSSRPGRPRGAPRHAVGRADRTRGQSRH